jgi:ATP-binding cassette subfamily C (CFTR/MRP) protein 4
MRESILFGLPYDSERYNAVIEACALDKDIESLPNGDLTIVGERGVTLSGGQKARVNLARAIYHEADVYLLDDPLSAVDAAVSRHIFNKCIRGILSEKCVILATHQIRYLNECDVVLELREGCMEVYGDPRDILQYDTDLLGSSNNEEPDHMYTIRKHSIPLHDSIEPIMNVVMNDVQAEEENLLDDETLGLLENDNTMEEPKIEVFGGLPEEENSHGRITLKTYCQYIIAGGGYIFTGIVMLIFILTEINMVLSDWWMSDW